MAGHVKCILLPVLSIILIVLVHGMKTFSLDHLEPFLRSAETQARAYALFSRPEHLLVWDQSKGEEKQSTETQRLSATATVSVP